MPEFGNGNYSVTKFECTIPVPSYLIAIAVGDLYNEHLSGGDINIITEPGFMSKVLDEFSGLYPYYNGLQEYFYKNPYPWDGFTILVLPPSFPVGGMENPLLTFISPTVITGDKSQIHVVAHEMAHSWTGNMVTAANWENLWLNEGFTTFVERKVTS